MRFLSLALVLLIVSVAPAQRRVCGPGGCYTVSDSVVYSQPLPEGWIPSVDADVLCFVQKGQYVGAFRKSTQQYHAVTNGTLGKAGGLPSDVPDPDQGTKKVASPPAGKDCPCGPECPCCALGKQAFGQAVPEAEPGLNFGVNRSKIDKEKTYCINGHPVTKDDAMRAMQGEKGFPGIPDDAKFDSLTVIGTPDQCKPVEEDFAKNKAFDGIRDKMVFQSYRADDPMVAEIGITPGSPAIYHQKPDGKVLARYSTYPGPEKVATEIRKRNPDYDPNKDPKPDAPGPEPPKAPETSGIVIALIVAFMAWLLGGNKQ